MIRLYRKKIPAELVAAFREATIARLAAFDAAEPDDTSLTVACYRKQGGIPLTAFVGTPVLHQLGEVLDALAPANTRHSWQHSSARRQDPRETAKALGWHQDWVAMEMHEQLLEGMTFWIPLDEIDNTRPTLEFMDDWTPLRYEHEANEENGFATIKNPMVRGMQFRATEFSPGDLIAFAPFVLHRTFVVPEMTNSRLSLDVRYREGW